MEFSSQMSRREIARLGVAISSAAVVTRSLGGSVFAQDASPVPDGAPGLPPLPDGATVIAEGLLNPRNLAWGDDGTLYITENGIGGDEILMITPPGEEPATPAATPVVASDPEATPVAEEAPVSTRGYTGQISAVAPNGTQSTIVSGLASYSDGAGPVGIAVVDGDLIFTIGGVAVGFGLPDQLPEENMVNRFSFESGEVELIVELGSAEVENNLDGTDVNPNLYDLVALEDGSLIVNDAGGNVTYSIDAETGEFEAIAVYPLQGELPDGSADPAGLDRQVVPTGLALDDEENLYTAFLSEFWPADGPSIVQVAEDGETEAVATGLSVIVDIAYGPDGFLYASSLTADLSIMAPGGVFRIGEDGTAEEVVGGLFMPHGIVFDEDGNLYVSVYTLISAPGFAGGQVVRFDGIATPA
ncbi:MAG: ScyD/ScyE family protein [Thermomicrobiales bacterium]